MKKKINVMVSVLLCIVSVLAVYRSVSYIVTMAEGGNAVKPVEIPKKDRSKEIGTKENPFLLLEIVPNKAMATVSYLFAGCEPVDMEKVGYSREGNYLLTTVGITPGLIKSEKVTEYVFEEEWPADKIKPKETDDNLIGEWISTKGEDYAEYGYYEYAGEGKGEFSLKEDLLVYAGKNQGDIRVNDKAFSYVGNGMGSYQWVKTASYAYVGETNGNYNRVETKEGVVEFQEVGEGNGKYQKKMFLDGEEENTEGRFWMLRTDKQYYRMHHYEYTNPDYLLENAFGRTAKDGFVSKAVVITPDQLQRENLRLIDEADMIAISAWDDGDGILPGAKTKLWELFNKEGASLTDAEKSQRTFIDRKDKEGNDVKGNDLSWEATLKIVNRMASATPAGIMLDQKHTYENSTSGAYNVGKLYIMLMQYGAKRFKERYMDDSILDADGQPRFRSATGGALGVKTGYYDNPHLTYDSDPQKALEQKTTWDQYTFTTGTDQQNKLLMDCPYLPSGRNNAKDTIITYNGDMKSFWNMRAEEIEEFPKDPNNPDYLGSNSEMFDYFTKEGERPTKLTFNDGYAFILRGLKAGQTEYKKKLRILELQPCAEFIYGSEDWKLYYSQLFPWFTGDYDNPEQLSVTTMASIEFNADITDINSEYDMIICGLNQNESNGKDGYAYNDPYLGSGKLRYTSLGGLVDTNAWGWEYKKKEDVQAFSSKGSDAYQSNARYSGNDITKKKYEELKDFLAAGKPIVVAEDFYQWEGKIDTSKVDQSSYIYKLVTPLEKSGMETVDPMNQALTKKETLFRFGKHSKAALKEALAYENCRLEIADYPAEYDYDPDKLANGENKKVTYTDKNGQEKSTSVSGIIKAGSVKYNTDVDKDGNMQLRYRFTVQGREEEKYEYGVNLYIDRDGNGIFEDSLKEQKELAAAGQNGMGSSNEEKVAQTTFKITDETGQKIDPNKLLAGHTYLLTRSLPDSERGILPWKLELSAQANQSIRSSVINYTCIQKKDSEKTKIKVLQMNLTPDMKNNANTFVNFSDTNTKTGARFAAYLAAVPEFDVQIHYMDNYDIEDIENIDNDEDKKAALGEIASWEDITNLEEDWNKVKYWSNIFCDTNYTEKEQLKHWKEYLSEIDMLIIGFCDNACFTENEVFYKGFMDFVEQGKGVILSHDLVKDATDYYRHPDKVTSHDPELRTLAGQRRKYYNTKATEGSEEWNKFCYNEVQLNGNPVSLLPKNDRKGPEVFRIVKQPDGQQVEQPVGKYYISTVSSISYDKNGESVEIKRSEYMDNSLRLFMTFGEKNIRDRAVNEYNYDKDNDNGNEDDEYDKFTWGWPGSSKTSYVKKANQGQITTYPYAIEQNIRVAVTHGQNYQLDLEQSSGGDVTVWFNLTDKWDSDVTPGAKNDGIYSSRSGDAANHYYIYTKGNITYTGLGHSREEHSDPKKASPLTDSEVRLFVNTMIASYRVTPEVPYIEVTNKDASKNGDEYFLYLLQTGEEMIDTKHKTYTVKFMVNDGGLTADGNSRYYLQYQDSDGNVLNPQPDTTKYKDAQLELVGADGESPQYRVSNLGEYSFEVPYSDILDDGVAVYNLKLTTKYMRGTKEYSRTRTSRITIYATPLFELN